MIFKKKELDLTSSVLRFLSFILLPKVRQDIADNKKLNSHLYESLKKALFKPAAFFKGIVLPLCESDGQNSSSAAGLTNEDTTLREATIISSVLGKMSVPVLHSAAALLKLSQLSYSGPRSIFIKTLLDKRYALPERVVEAMVSYFLRFRGDSAEYPEQLPVLWHQSLLIFTQRYKHQLSHEQLDALTNLATKEHSHHQITPEIVRELEQGRIMQA